MGIVTALPSQGYFAAISSPGNSLIVNSVFLSVSLFKIWTTDSTQVSEVTLMPNCEKRKENQMIGVTGVAHNQHFRELSEVPSIINGCCFHLPYKFFSF